MHTRTDPDDYSSVHTPSLMSRLSLVPRLLRVGGEKRAWYTLFLGILEISVKPVRYTNLHETCLPLTTLCVDDDKGAIKAISSSLTGIIYVSMRSS